MAEYSYSTRVSLIKAGKIISTKIVLSLCFIWAALAIGCIFLWMQNAALLPFQDGNNAYDGTRNTSSKTNKQMNDGAFVFVVKDKKIMLTRYTAYIDKSQPDNDIADNAHAAAEKTVAAVVRKRKTNETSLTKQPDFTVKRIPF